MYLKLISTPINSVQQLKTALASFIHSNDILHLLIKNDRGNLALNVGKRFKVAELASAGVTLDDDNTAVALHADGNLGAGLVDGELAREAATSGNILEKGELSGVCVDREVDDGIRVNCLGLVVEARDVVDVFAAGRSDEESIIGLCVHFMLVQFPCPAQFFFAKITYRYNNLRSSSVGGNRLALAVRANGKDLLQVDGITAVGDIITDNGVAEFGNEVHESLGSADGKGNMAWSTARGGLYSWQGLCLERVGVKGEEADEIATEIRNDEVLARRVENGLMRMRRVLLGMGPGPSVNVMVSMFFMLAGLLTSHVLKVELPLYEGREGYVY